MADQVIEPFQRRDQTPFLGILALGPSNSVSFSLSNSFPFPMKVDASTREEVSRGWDPPPVLAPRFSVR